MYSIALCSFALVRTHVVRTDGGPVVTFSDKAYIGLLSLQTNFEVTTSALYILLIHVCAHYPANNLDIQLKVSVIDASFTILHQLL